MFHRREELYLGLKGVKIFVPQWEAVSIINGSRLHAPINNREIQPLGSCVVHVDVSVYF